MNEVGSKIDVDALMTDTRRFNADVTRNQLYAGGRNKVMSWGANSWGIFQDKQNETYALRFTVNGHHFRGHIYIVLNGLDLYDVYYCSNRGNIKMIDTDLYNDMLTDVIDRKIEYIDAYAD